MAVPADFTILDISGKFTLNKTLSGKEMDTILQLQGVSWLTRKVIAYGTITLFIKHYKEEDTGIEHIDIDQTITGGIPGTSEKRTLIWQWRENDDHIFGHVRGRTRRVQVAELEEPFLKEGWTPDTTERGVVQSYVESDTAKSGTSWIADQTWGIEDIEGVRRYVRHVKFTGPKGEDIQLRMVYDYLGPV